MDPLSLITLVISDNLKKLFTKLTKDFGSEVSHIVNNNILEYQVEEYNRNYYTKSLLHRVQPKILKDFYQPLFIQSCDGKKVNVEDIPRIPTSSIKELFNKRQFITLIGTAGSGKSTLVKYLFLNSFDTKFKIPIKIELRYLNDYKASLTEYIKEKIFKLNKLATHDKIIERLLQSGDFIFFLDGYDEIISTKKEAITKEIDNLVKIYNKNFYILTTRPFTDIELLPLFHNYEVCNLSDEDINQFIKKQIPFEENELASKIIQAVNSNENIAYKSFLSNPLLLSMFILTFQSYSSIPQKRSEFYNQVFDALFSVHDSMSKLAFVREKQCGLSKEQFIEVLKLFSFISYFEEQFIFTNLYLQHKLLTIKERKKELVFDNEKLISDLQIAIGILNKEGPDYAFPHRSLQEYFAAIYISSLSDSNKKTVYTKIMKVFKSSDYFRATSKDNFHLLLSELDEAGVIKFGLIPYFDSCLKNYIKPKKTYTEIIEDFGSLHSVFESFNYILKTNELSLFEDQLNTKFRSAISEHGKKGYGTEYDEKIEIEREKLAIADIKPFIKKYLPKLTKLKDDLNQYLLNQNKSDSDIISLI
jgi:GTPase SAR1 family protein